MLFVYFFSIKQAICTLYTIWLTAPTSDIFLYQILSITLFSYLNYNPVKRLRNIMLVGTDVCVRMVFVWEETEVPGGNPPVWLGDHMPAPHIGPGSQWWEASALTLRQPDSHQILKRARFHFNHLKYILLCRTKLSVMYLYLCGHC